MNTLQDNNKSLNKKKNKKKLKKTKPVIAKCRLKKTKKKVKMVDNIKAFKAAARELDVKIPRALMDLLDDAASDVHGALMCVDELKRQCAVLRVQNNTLKDVNDKLQAAGKQMTVRLREVYQECNILRVELEHTCSRFNKQRAKIVELVDHNNIIAVDLQVQRRAVAYLVNIMTSDEGLSYLTLEQKTALDQLTNGSFFDRLRKEASEEIQQTINKKQ